MTVTSEKSKLKIALSGVGLIGRKHAELVLRSSRSELIGIVAPATKHNLDFIETIDLPRFDRMQDVFSNLRVDAVIIASPNEFHFEQAMCCIEHGIPILIEKPLTKDIACAKTLCAKAAEANTTVLVGHHRTYSVLLPAAHKFIHSNFFGRLVAVQGSALFRKPDDYFDDGPWRKRIGGGPILINLIHDIGILQYLCGPIKSIWAQSSNSVRGFDVEDSVAIGYSFENGALGTFILSDVAASDKSWEMTSQENPAYPYSPAANCYHFAGTNGSLDFPSFKARHYGQDIVPSWWNEFTTQSQVIERTDPLKQQLAHFEDVILHGAEPIVSAKVGLANMRVVEAIKRAIDEGRQISINSI